MTRRYLFAFAAALMFWCPLYPQAESPQDERQTKIYDVKWRDADYTARFLQQSAPQARIEASRTFKTITVIGPPSVQAMVAELLRKYDQPAKEIEFQFYLLRAYRQGAGIKDGVPDHVRAILGEIGSFTTFKAFELIDSPVVRATEGEQVSVNSAGTLKGRVSMGGPRVTIGDDGKATIQIDRFNLAFEGLVSLSAIDKRDTPYLAGLNTSFRIMDGETIVIGSSRVQEAGKPGGDAIIAVVTARLLSRGTGQ